MCWACSAAIILGFTVPRVPGFAFNNNFPLQAASGQLNASIPTYFNRAPANFSFPAWASLQVDTSSNYLPVKFTSLDARVYDLITLREVATGHLKDKTLPGKTFPKMLMPLNFTYVANNDSDITCKCCFGAVTLQMPDRTVGANWYNACKNSAIFPNGQRPRTFSNISEKDHWS
jgi:hypothetical protein